MQLSVTKDRAVQGLVETVLFTNAQLEAVMQSADNVAVHALRTRDYCLLDLMTNVMNVTRQLQALKEVC